MQTFSNTQNLVLCGLCAAITCVLAPISIPLAGGVPISLATFAVMLAGALLGASMGAVSQFVYLLLGAIGLPVFAGWTGGLDKIVGMTGGYLVGYIPLAWLTGLIYHRFGHGRSMKVRIAWMVIGMTLGNIALYVLGTIWFMVVTGMDLQASLAACVIPFIPGNFIKMAAVVVIAPPIEAAIRHISSSSAVSA